VPDRARKAAEALNQRGASKEKDSCLTTKTSDEKNCLVKNFVVFFITNVVHLRTSVRDVASERFLERNCGVASPLKRSERRVTPFFKR